MVPILVRPHPERDGHYQIAYGHRRVAAARKLGIKVRAIVRNLSNEELVIAQGQENNARLDLSYIEKALFAVKLEEAGFNRQVIGSSLAVSKTELSGMISVATKIPREVILAVGAAPGIGRPRWHELTEIFKLQKCFDKASEIISKPDFASKVIGRAVPDIVGETFQKGESRSPTTADLLERSKRQKTSPHNGYGCSIYVAD